MRSSYDVVQIMSGRAWLRYGTCEFHYLDGCGSSDIRDLYFPDKGVYVCGKVYAGKDPNEIKWVGKSMDPLFEKWADEGKISPSAYSYLTGEGPACNSLTAQDGSSKISVLISTYKRPAYLVRLLNSIRIQQYDNYEIIIVDDASDDDTGEKVKQFKEENPDINVIYLVNEQNAGAGESRKRAYLKATGDVIIFVDDDDYYIEPAYFSMLNTIYETHSDCTMTVSDTIQHTEGENRYEYRGLNTPRAVSNREYLNGFGDKYTMPYIFAVSFKSTLLSSVHYEELLCFNHISLLLYAMLGEGNVYTMNQAVGIRTFHTGNMTGNTTAEFIVANMESKEDIYHRAMAAGLLDSPKEWHYRHLSGTAGYHFANNQKVTANDKIIFSWMKNHFERADYYRFVAKIVKTRIRRWLRVHFGF